MAHHQTDSAQTACLTTPIGFLQVTVDGAGAVVRVAFVEASNAEDVAEGSPLHTAIVQLAEYFNGRRDAFDLDLRPAGTEFEHRVWSEVREIPHGATDSYGGIAARLGQAGLSRAVGLANARNPIAILIPCHRVVGGGGDLTGYAGGLWRKKWLLAHEAGQDSLPFE
jgi:methylated-DNA-[protein]-cysteine S-methyltransferase